jgi:hypothetical protein
MVAPTAPMNYTRISNGKLFYGVRDFSYSYTRILYVFLLGPFFLGRIFVGTRAEEPNANLFPFPGTSPLYSRPPTPDPFVSHTTSSCFPNPCVFFLCATAATGHGLPHGPRQPRPVRHHREDHRRVHMVRPRCLVGLCVRVTHLFSSPIRIDLAGCCPSPFHGVSAC